MELCVKALVQEVPDLAFSGFCVGESNMPTSFYEDSYLRGLKEAAGNDCESLFTQLGRFAR